MGAFPHQMVTGGLLEVSTVLPSYLVKLENSQGQSYLQNTIHSVKIY